MSNSAHYADISIENGVPCSTQFDDIYFSPQDGMGESHYNFIEGNQLPERFSNLLQPVFTIAETGFGTGLNFFLTAELWQETVQNNQLLHYVSVEKYPIQKKFLEEIYQKNNWQNDLTDTFLQQYANCTAGHNQIKIGNNIQLSLLIGEAIEQFQQLDFSADAWFLDGFAPNKNPDMWSPELFHLIAQKTNNQGSFATFTAASMVRKNLQAAGFAVNKGEGFGRKRERLLGYYSGKRCLL